jgi:pyrroline-5-carboxylate reductase
MPASTVGFIGGGRIVQVILGGWQRAGYKPADVVISEPNEEVLSKLKRQFPIVRGTPEAASLLGQMEVVFVAVHPPAVVNALELLTEHLSPDCVVVSLAPKVLVAQLSAGLGGFSRIARTIPNAPSLVGAGFNPVHFGPGLDEAGRERVLALLRPLGESPVVPEDHLEAYAVLTAMGPTYIWFQLQQLRELGQSFGLPLVDVDTGLAAMVLGAVPTLFRSGLTTEEVMDLVPVKPMHEDEEVIRTAYKNRLTTIYAKLKS